MPLTENRPTATRIPGLAAPGKENAPPEPAATTSASAPVTSSITTPARVFRRSRSQRRGRGRSQRRGRGRSQRRGRGRSQRRGRN